MPSINSIHLDFGILVIILLIVGNEVTQVKRKLEKIEALLTLTAKVQRWDIAPKLNDKLDDIREKLDQVLSR
jgi:hypothetical protein